MFTSNSYLAPEAVTRRKRSRDAIAELWRAESFLDARKISGEKQKIEWFIRGCSDEIIRWYISLEHNIKNFEEFEYVLGFGSDENKETILINSCKADQSVGEYTRKLLRLVVSKEIVDQNDVNQIIVKLGNSSEAKEMKKKIWRRPRGMPYRIWFVKILDRINRKEDLRIDCEKSESSGQYKLECIEFREEDKIKETTLKEHSNKSVKETKPKKDMVKNMNHKAGHEESVYSEEAVVNKDKEEVEDKYLLKLQEKFSKATDNELNVENHVS
jgi:hypothetical protein